jgi:hypothetical protein
MTDEEVKAYLKIKGWPERFWQGGREALIQRWKDFIASLEIGERTRNWLIDDYWINLEGRELIHDIGSDGRVKEADDRLRAMLTATHIKHYRRERESDYDFWNYGHPKNA